MDKIRPAGDREQIGTPQSNGDKQGRAGPDEQSNVGHHPPSLSAAVHGKRRLSGLLSSSSNAPSVPLTRPVPAAAYTNPYLSPELSLSSPALLFASSSRQKSSVQSIQHQVAAMPPKPAGKDIPAFFPGMDEFYYAPKKSVKSSGASTSGTSTKSGSSTKSPSKSKPKERDGPSLMSKDSDPTEPADSQGHPRRALPAPVPSESIIQEKELTTAEQVAAQASNTDLDAVTGKTFASSPSRNLPSFTPSSSSPPPTFSILPSTSSPPSRRLALSTSPPTDHTSTIMSVARGTPPSAHGKTTLKKRAASASSSTAAAGLGITGVELEPTSGMTISRDQRQDSVTDIAPSHSPRPFRNKNHARHHALPLKVAPYPRSYDTRAIDQDTADHLLLTSLCRSVTWHDFAPILPNSSTSNTTTPATVTAGIVQSSIESTQNVTFEPPLTTPTLSDSSPQPTTPTPVPESAAQKTPAPRSVLDLGCGNGVWIMDCAKVWPDAHFVGLDLVPLQPNLSVVDPKLANRIEWVTANFLQRLPFPDSHFDYVHIRRIARGVPEDKWPDLLEEVSRVLEPNGAIEILEEDLIFPGGSEPCTCHYPPDWNEGEEDARNEDTMSSELNHQSPEKDLHHSGYQGLFYPSQSVDVRDHSHLEQAYNDMHADRFINLRPISVLTNVLPLYFRDVRSHPPLLITFPPPEEEMWSDASSLSSTSGESDASVALHNRKTLVATPKRQKATIPKSPHLSRPSTANSSAIYSIDSSAVESSHGGSPPQGRSPLQQQPPTLPLDGQVETVTNGSSPSEYMHQPPQGGWHTLHIDIRALVHPKQPFIMIDRCRMPARVVSAGADSQNLADQTMTRLPNTTFEFDFQYLTMSLAHSVTEVLECKEEIWEYMVRKGEAKPGNGSNIAAWTGLGMSLATSGEWSEGEAVKTKKPIRSRSPRRDEPIERKDFDFWVSNYEREMKRRIQMAKVMRSRLDWKPRELVSSEFHSSHSHRPSMGNSVSGPGGKILSPITPGGWSSVPAPFGTISTENPTRRLDPSDHPHSSSLEDINTALNVQEDDLDEHHHQSAVKGAHSSSTSLVGNESSSVGARKRTNSGPEKLQRTRRGSGHSSQQGHARNNSLDAADAWETLVQEKPHLASLRADDGTIAGSAMDRDSKAVDENGFADDIPRLSRCVKVFVAWNNKDET